MTDPRFLKGAGFEAFTGNELLLKGGLEGRMALLTGYPGSPVSDVFDAIFQNRDLLKEHGILGQMANNEALAAARLNGARMSSIRAMAVMKSVGMHVAADGLAIGNLSEPNHPEGGAVVVVGDDPWNETTQINSDSRFLAQHLHMPILEPSTFQELKDWIDPAFELSGATNLYVAYIITTNQADGGASVQVKPNHYPTVNFNRQTELSSAQLPIRDFVMIPPHTSQKEATLKGRYEKFLEIARAKKLNQLFYLNGAASHPLGFIASGMSYAYLEHALAEMGLSGVFPILKLGVTHPLDKGFVREFLERVHTVVVVEEKRPFLENQVKAILQEVEQEGRAGAKMHCRVFGKNFPDNLPGIPEVRGLNPSVLIERIGPLLLSLDLPQARSKKGRIGAELAVINATARFKLDLPLRTPTFCPGCPHRDSAVVSLKLKKEFKENGSDVLFHGESGCHSMLQFAPNEGLMQNYSGMGLGGGTGAGIDHFVKNKQVVFLGDSTFFHSGMIAVSDSIKNRQDITYVVLDNKTTAMTGHQPTPGNDFDILGRATFAQDIEKVVRGMAGGSNIPILRADPADRAAYTLLLEDLVKKPGVKIVIADKECGITFQRRVKTEKKALAKEKGFIPREEVINITPEVCEYCLECTQATGCPGLTAEETEFGPKIVTDLSTCVSDSACAKGKVCPSFERIVIKRSKPARRQEIEARPENLPLPLRREMDDPYYISTFAVGGMGGGIISSILVRAGLKEEYQVSFLDKKGLAIRNGSVYGHIIFSKKARVFSPVVPYGKANLVLGVDILETARGLDPKVNMRVASPDRTCAVVNTHKTPTVNTLMGVDDFDPKVLDEWLRRNMRSDQYLSFDFSELSQKLLGSTLYANLLLLGAAFQKGLLPFSLGNLEIAVRETVSPKDLEENLKAFHLGREIVLHPGKFLPQVRKKSPSYQQVLEKKTAILRSRFFGKKLAAEYRQMMEKAVRWMHMDEATNRKLAVRVYELIQYENLELARRYVGLLWEAYRKDNPKHDYAATKAAVDNLFKVMAIKDEVYVAHLLTSREKFERDRERYGVDESNGDRMDYTHLNRPEFDVLGFKVEFDLKTRNWMLNIMKHCKFLRRWLAEWHHREKEFRDWYIEALRKFNYFQSDSVYRSYVEVLKSPELVRGYRKVRYPKMEEARNKAERILSLIRPEGDPESREAVFPPASDAELP